MARVFPDTPASLKPVVRLKRCNLTKGQSLNTTVIEDVSDTPRSLTAMKQRLERQFIASSEVEDKTSPGLARLRETPGKSLKQKQALLVQKHNDSRKRSDQLNVGGGVTLWPEMESMRLNKEDLTILIPCTLGIFLLVVFMFNFLHGTTVQKLIQFENRLSSFPSQHMIWLPHGQTAFISSYVAWHNDFRVLLDEIHREFDVSRLSPRYQVYILLYFAGIATLCYYLVDNMFSRSKLSPRRIKKWVLLLVVVATYTVLILYMLVRAQKVENAVEHNVHQLSNILADLVTSDLELSGFHTMLSYWTTRCLPPTTLGMLSILGVLPVRSVMTYLQYYSLPVITVLATPVVKLIMAIYSIYSVKT